MGQGEETKSRPQPGVEIQERGEIFFFYRPKVDKAAAHGAGDVQRLYLVLRPESGESPVEEKQDPRSGKEGALAHDDHIETNNKNKNKELDDDEEAPAGGRGSQQENIEKQALLRLIVMGRKRLPDPTKKSTPYWGFVELVTTNIQHLRDALKGEEYETATRGHRHLPVCRAAGEGVYRILRHMSRGMTHTHLVYKLEYPPEGEKEEPQEALHIAREASFVLQIKNPDQTSSVHEFRGLTNKRKAAFPAHLQGHLGKLRFHPADPPDFLNYEGCEFLLISASDDIEQELGLELEAEQPQHGTSDADECCDLLKTFGETTASTRPLFHGTWD